MVRILRSKCGPCQRSLFNIRSQKGAVPLHSIVQSPVILTWPSVSFVNMHDDLFSTIKQLHPPPLPQGQEQSSGRPPAMSGPMNAVKRIMTNFESPGVIRREFDSFVARVADL